MGEDQGAIGIELEESGVIDLGCSGSRFYGSNGLKMLIQWVKFY